MKFTLKISGSAGTGKSFLLRQLKAALSRQYGEGLAVTASTGIHTSNKKIFNIQLTFHIGIAAINIGGCTLHRWAGLGISGDFARNKFKAAKNKYVSTRTFETTSNDILPKIHPIFF